MAHLIQQLSHCVRYHLSSVETCFPVVKGMADEVKLRLNDA